MPATTQPDNNTQRYFLHLAFLGTNYHGWQRQPNAASVQQTLEEALSTLLRTPICTTGAGRTDTGVHAHHMVAHFDSPAPLDAPRFLNRLNRLLPPDIAALLLHPVPPSAHARFSATARTYHYHISLRRDPFLTATALYVPYPLDFPLMQQAADILLPVTDFASFCKANADSHTTICHLTDAQWFQVDDHHWFFRISADRFLRNMVRAIVGTLLDVGRHHTTLDQFSQIIQAHTRSAAAQSIPPQGLTLHHIDYPPSLIPPPTSPEGQHR